MHTHFHDFSTRLKGLFMLSLAASSALASPAPCSSASASSPALPSASASASASPKRIVQYYGSPLAVGNRVHIAPIVNNTRPIYATNVLFATWTLRANHTMQVDAGEGHSTPDNSTLDFAWSEIREVQKAGVPVSMFFRGGFGLLNDATAFDGLYGTLRAALVDYKFDGIDLDIEDIGDANPITLDTTVKLIRQLRANFGEKFIITLAPVATALSGGTNLSKFDYTQLEKQVGGDIAWYNAQFYGTGALTVELFDAVIGHGWAPNRIAISMASSPDFQTGTFPLSDLDGVLANITAKHPGVRGMAGFDYYDQCPGGWAAPWQWPVWAAVKLGLAPANATDSFAHGIKTCGANRA